MVSDVDSSHILLDKSVKEFRILFSRITGLFTSFYFPQWQKGNVDFVPRGAEPRYCQMLKSCPGGLERCVSADAAVAEEVRRKGKPVIFACYAGVTGIAVPVYFRDEFVGAVFAGDGLTKPPSKRAFSRISKNLVGLDIDPEELEQAYYEIPVMPNSALRTASDLLSFIANYMVDRENIIALQESIYGQQKAISDIASQRLKLEEDVAVRITEVDRLRSILISSTDRDQETPALTQDCEGRLKRVVGEARRFVDAHCAEDITLADVAGHVNLSPTYLSSIFHKHCGCTFAQYVVQRRIAKACELLQDFRLNVTEVGMQVGYSNLSYFNQVFKRHVGLPPGKYRNRLASK